MHYGLNYRVKSFWNTIVPEILTIKPREVLKVTTFTDILWFFSVEN